MRTIEEIKQRILYLMAEVEQNIKTLDNKQYTLDYGTIIISEYIKIEKYRTELKTLKEILDYIEQ